MGAVQSVPVPYAVLIITLRFLNPLRFFKNQKKINLPWKKVSVAEPVVAVDEKQEEVEPAVVETFSLFRLPHVALKVALQCFNPIELYQLAKCSTKTSNIIPIAGTKKFKVTILAAMGVIEINKYRFAISNGVGSYPHMFYLLHEDGMNTLKTAFSEIQRIFKCPIRHLKYRNWYKYDSKLGMIQLIRGVMKNQTEPLESLRIKASIRKKDLQWILENVKVKKRIDICLENIREYPIDFQPECEHVAIDSWFLVPLDNLLRMKSSKFIELSRSRLTLEDIHNFMKEWQSGEFPMLEYLMIGGAVLNEDGTVLGFSRGQMGIVREVQRIKMINRFHYSHCTKGVDIEAVDGTKATMQINTRNVFKLFVWRQ
ncbi:unnamed protein product [Caenorhabditis brenneri]